MYSIFEHLEEYSYEILKEYDENEELLQNYDIVRRDTRDKEPTNRPGVGTEHRPPFPRNPFTTSLPPKLTMTTTPSPKQTTEPTTSTSVLEGPTVKNSSSTATTRNYTLNVSTIGLTFNSF